MKILITHFNPDLDAIAAIWLFKKFDIQFKEAQVFFVPAGKTYQNQLVDSNPDIVHVDTGLGKFDHHQLAARTCAAKLVFDYLKQGFKYLKQDAALHRLISLVLEIDNFEECLWPEAISDRWDLTIFEMLNGLKLSGKVDDFGLIDFGRKCLDGVYAALKIKNEAENELEKGIKFTTKWGSAIACQTANNFVINLGQKQGFVLVLQKDPVVGHIRLKARPDSKINLSHFYERVSKLDPKATWFLHINKKMLLNGSTRNPKMKPTKLTLNKLIKLLQEKEEK